MIPDKYKTLLAMAGIAIATIAVFWQVHNFEFVNYDDNRYVTENQHVITGLSRDNIIWAFGSSHFFMWHPMTSLSHMLDCQLFGLNPNWHHLTSLMFHIANVLLLFGILKVMTGRLWPSAFVAAMFAVHPMNVESVAWVAERKNVLSGFFWLLTIAVYVRYVKLPRTSNYLLLIFAFSLALMSKPTTVTLPFVLLLLDYWPLDRFLWTEKSKQPYQSNLHVVYRKLSLWQLVKEKIPLFILSAVLCIITVVSQKGGDVLKLNEQLPLVVRLANALVSYVTYIGKMIYPTHLAVFYPHPRDTLPTWEPIASFIILAVASVVATLIGRSRYYVVVGWLWFMGTLIPVIGLVQAGSQAMADRYSYIPLIGLFIIVAWGAADLLQKWKYQKIILSALSIAVLLVLGVCTTMQTSYWRSSQCLFEHAIKVTKGNYIACNNLGFILLEQNKIDEAIDLFLRALQIKPDHAEAYNNLGMAYGKLGRKQEEMEAYKQAMKFVSNHAETYYNVGITLNQQGRYNEAIDAFKQAIKINPELAQAYYNLGIAYGKIGRVQDEIETYQKAIKLKPDYLEVYNNLGVAYGQLGQRQQAVEAYEYAIKIKPDYADAYNNLGVAFGQLGRFRESIQAFRKAVDIKPDFAEAHCGLGISYVMAGDKNSAANEYEILKKLDTAQAAKLFSIISSK